MFLRVRLYFSEKLKSPYAFADGDFFCGNINNIIIHYLIAFNCEQ